MATTAVSFDVHIGDRLTFDEAENLARWHAARRGIRVEINKVTVTAKHRYREEMATVTRDALGRIWTDLTWHGAAFI
jgi:hypothetical protein